MSTLHLLLAGLTLARCASSSQTTTPAYNLVSTYSGENFFDNFEFYTGADPTNGYVNYTDQSLAESLGLVTIHGQGAASTAYIGVDHTTVASTARNSVRISSKQVFDSNTLFVIDAQHVPVGYGLWPAMWLLGTAGTWPAGGGEIDFFESVHESTFNTITLHSAPGCTVDSTPTNYLGVMQGTDCNAGSGSTGCSLHAPNTTKVLNAEIATAGSAFNTQGGGIFVIEWADSGIRVWQFSRDMVPAILNSNTNLTTADFPKPAASFTGSGCNYAETFRQMTLILNIDFCGDWAGKVWESSGAAASTGTATCNEYVANNPSSFADAYFSIGGIRIFSANGAQPGKNPNKREEPATLLSKRDSPISTSSANGLKATLTSGWALVSAAILIAALV